MADCTAEGTEAPQRQSSSPASYSLFVQEACAKWIDVKLPEMTNDGILDNSCYKNTHPTTDYPALFL